MRTARKFIPAAIVGWFGCLLVTLMGGCCMRPNSPAPVRALILTGGHGYEQAPFEAMFNSFETIEPTFAVLDPEGHGFETISDWPYDVIVFYHFDRSLTEKSRENLLKLTENGVGIVVLHHALAGFPEWPEWRNIAGATYFLKDTQEDGTLWPACTWQHDVRLSVHVEDTAHPVTAGVADFEILDETYKGYRLEPGNHLLLTSDHPLIQKEIGWTRTYENSRICALQSGHGPEAYANPAYRTLVLQAIRWCAAK